MNPIAAAKALTLVSRYARLQSRIGQCKRTALALYGKCERPLHEAGGSGCLNDLGGLMSENRKGNYDLHLSFEELVDEAEFCRHCKVGLNLRMHVKHNLGKRRSAVLAAICRLGNKQVRK